MHASHVIRGTQRHEQSGLGTYACGEWAGEPIARPHVIATPMKGIPI